MLIDSKVSTAAGSDEPEWSSEAVQIGGSGAAVGFLGLWTGAMHERSDPLGECWYLTERVWLLTVHGRSARSILGLEGCVKWKWTYSSGLCEWTITHGSSHLVQATVMRVMHLPYHFNKIMEIIVCISTSSLKGGSR